MSGQAPPILGGGGQHVMRRHVLTASPHRGILVLVKGVTMNVDTVGYLRWTPVEGIAECTHPETFWNVMPHLIACRLCGMVLAGEGK